MHVYIPCARAGGGGGGGGGRVYEIKTLRSILAHEEGGGRLFKGGVYIIEQERYTS